MRVASAHGTSDGTVHAIEREVRRLLGEAVARAGATIERHRAAYDRLVAALLAHETLEHSDLAELLGAPAEAATALPLGGPIPPTRGAQAS
jgi:ATP-dependent Zn protease